MTMINKLESLQKKCIKWILSEEHYNYNAYDIYLRKCQQVRLLPLVKRFDFIMISFYSIKLYTS